jgi:heme A synthase
MPNEPSRVTLRRTAWAGVAMTVGLIVLGGVVRITGSGMGCGESWPLCNGEWFPPLDLPTLIESSHRWVAALVSIFIAATAWISWRRHRATPYLWRPAVLTLALLIVQVLLGAVTVKLELPPWVVIVHLLNSMVLLATLTVTALRASGEGPPIPADQRHSGHLLILVTTGFSLLVVLLGAQVANLNAAFMCLGFPFCDGFSILPPPGPLGALHWIHRVTAYLLVVLVVTIFWAVRRERSPTLGRAAATALGFVLLQIAIAAVMILRGLPGEWRGAHILGGTLVWLGMVVLAYVSARTPSAGSASTRLPITQTSGTGSGGNLPPCP